ncbi:60S ribosomal protein L3 [Mycena chlorophos]|uniref:Large ribosomal subunit protein mL44 n=1 Tax=Mycena chlorophos TaxID=658473 RepID=A0A8H6WBG7_MYCCL|nr:60S ribosomal protein L3 [Mycena chlorophos]
MVYGQRGRVVNHALQSAVSVAHLKKFPPPHSTNFDAETWGQLQPPPPTALSAFAHRIGLGAVLTDPDVILQACTHPSAQHLAQRLDPMAPPLATNTHLNTLGNALMGLFATEYVHASYPHLPTRVMKAAVTAHVGPLSCSNVAQEMGAVPLLRWHREQPQTGTYQPPLQRSDALASITRSLVALVYQHRSLPSARQFVHSYFLSREVDIRSMIKFVDPKKALKEMVAKFQREPPKSRLLSETGRFSNSPVYVVGIYSGEDKLGEGFGASLKMAEYRAAEDALLSVYLTRTPSEQMQLPTSTFPLGLGDVFQSGQEGSYKAPQLEEAEVMYASGGHAPRIAA